MEDGEAARRDGPAPYTGQAPVEDRLVRGAVRAAVAATREGRTRDRLVLLLQGGSRTVDVPRGYCVASGLRRRTCRRARCGSGCARCRLAACRLRQRRGGVRDHRLFVGAANSGRTGRYRHGGLPSSVCGRRRWSGRHSRVSGRSLRSQICREACPDRLRRAAGGRGASLRCASGADSPGSRAELDSRRCARRTRRRVRVPDRRAVPFSCASGHSRGGELAGAGADPGTARRRPGAARQAAGRVPAGRVHGAAIRRGSVPRIRGAVHRSGAGGIQ